MRSLGSVDSGVRMNINTLVAVAFLGLGITSACNRQESGPTRLASEALAPGPSSGGSSGGGSSGSGGSTGGSGQAAVPPDLIRAGARIDGFQYLVIDSAHTVSGGHWSNQPILGPNSTIFLQKIGLDDLPQTWATVIAHPSGIELQNSIPNVKTCQNFDRRHEMSIRVCADLPEGTTQVTLRLNGDGGSTDVGPFQWNPNYSQVIPKTIPMILPPATVGVPYSASAEVLPESDVLFSPGIMPASFDVSTIESMNYDPMSKSWKIVRNLGRTFYEPSKVVVVPAPGDYRFSVLFYDSAGGLFVKVFVMKVKPPGGRGS